MCGIATTTMRSALLAVRRPLPSGGTASVGEGPDRGGVGRNHSVDHGFGDGIDPGVMVTGGMHRKERQQP